MLRGIAFFVIFIGYCHADWQTLQNNWLSGRISIPVTYIIELENVNIPLAKFKRSVSENDKTKASSIVNSKDETNRSRRTVEEDPNVTGNRSRRNEQQPPNLNTKANIRYHHQQRHPNGSVSGSYGQLDPKGQLQVMHYISDDQGYREYQENNELGVQASAQNQYPQYQPRAPPENINIISNGNTGQLPPDLYRHNRRGIEEANSAFLPNMQAPYAMPAPALPPGPPNASPQILHAAANSVRSYGPKSPLFDKYYRPTPEEVQRSYDYHRVRSGMDVNAFRPPEANSIPDIPRDKPMELKSTYSEYQIPYSGRARDEPPNAYYSYSAPLDDGRLYSGAQLPVDAHSPVSSNPLELSPSRAQYYSPIQYPQSVQPQTPIYVQNYDGQTFIPGSTYNGPYHPNTATFNHPFPTNVPVYDGPLPQNVPTYTHQLPDNIPVYNIAPQNLYYASASTAQPKLATNV